MWGVEQREEFEARGIAWMRGAVDARVVSELCERIWTTLRRRGGLERDQPSPDGLLRPKAELTRPLKKAGAFDLIHCAAVCEAADDLLGADEWEGSPSGPGLLLTPPGQQGWTVPHKVWHFDFPCPGGVSGLPGVQPFLLLDRVVPRGGTTVVVTGSHRLVARIQAAEDPGFSGRSAEVRARLTREVPWFRDLWSLRPEEDRVARFLDRATEHEGVPLQVVELTGEPGDVVVMHPWTTHAASPNQSSRARLALTDRLRSRRHPA